MKGILYAISPDKEVEMREWVCEDCGYRWFEYCESGEHPGSCPNCDKSLAHDEGGTCKIQTAMVQ